MQDKSDFKFNERDAQHWARKMFAQSIEPSPLLKLMPKPWACPAQALPSC